MSEGGGLWGIGNAYEGIDRKGFFFFFLVTAGFSLIGR